MPYYTSHIYIEAKDELLSQIKLTPQISIGLFHINQLTSSDTQVFAKGLPQNGLTVIREVCDPSKDKNDHNEARVHQLHNTPIVSWWTLQGPADIEIVTLPFIPTLAFGKLYSNQEDNPHPPLELLRFLKNLSLTQKTKVIFYHYYSAYEDDLANAEYAWVFSEQDFALVRHMDGKDNIMQYSAGNHPKLISSQYTRFSQPILQIVMKELGITLALKDERPPYFHKFNWSAHKI